MASKKLAQPKDHSGRFTAVPLAKRFWSRVDSSGGPDSCWPWMGARKHEGYGMAWVNGKNRPVAMIAWELWIGEPFPDGKEGCHDCDNPPCCNPGHIFPGSRRENILDALSKGRLVVYDRRQARRLRPERLRLANAIIGAGGSYEDVRIACGVSYHAVVKWERTGKIPRSRFKQGQRKSVLAKD